MQQISNEASNRNRDSDEHYLANQEYAVRRVADRFRLELTVARLVVALAEIGEREARS